MINKLNYLFVFFISLPINSQNNIKGIVLDSKKEKIAFALIEVKKDTISSPIYLYTDKKGFFEIKNFVNKCKLKVSALGYQTKIITLDLNNEALKKLIKIVLKEKIFNLDEVIIRTEKPIVVKKDTINFKTKFFAKGIEQTVEDLLKTIPGLNIETDGTIKVGSREIEKLMVDGDDLFGKGYKILSKNMPAFPIEEVEVLRNYSNNQLLKGIEESNKVALNLKLNEKSKRIWFGNIKTGSNFKNRYELLGNLMNFGKKNKFYFLTNLNNIGNNVTGDIDNLIKPFRINQPASIGDNQQVRNLIDLSSTPLNFKKSRTNYNNAKLLSLNAIFNPSKKLKIKTLVFLNWDKQDFFRNSVNNITANGTNFTNTEDYKLRNKKSIGFGKIDFTYNISKTKMIESTTKFNSENTNGQSNLVFNGASTIENLKTNNTLFDQKIIYSNKFKNKKIILLTGRFINEKTPQNYRINQFLYQNLFPNFTNANNVQQQSKNQMQFAGFEAHLLDRKTKGDLLELQFGNEFRKDKLNTTFTLFENSTIFETPNDFQNNTEYQTNDLYLKMKYRYKIKDFAITGKLGFHQLFNKLEFDAFSENENPFFINPSIGLSWEINDKNKITSSYSYNTSNAKILDVYNDYVLKGFRSFSKGTGNFNQLNASTLLFNYQLGNWSDVFFANTSVIYSRNFDFFSTNSFITQNYSQVEKIIIKDREMLSINTNIDRYFKGLSSNLKLNLGYSKSNYKNIVNNSELREVNSINYNYSFEIRSAFKNFFNYNIGSKWTVNEIKTTINNSFTNNELFLDLFFDINDNLSFQIQNERYFFGNIDAENSTYYFSDIETRYILKKNKISFSLSGKNLFNTDIFRTYSINDISTSTTEYRLLPRYVLLKIEYRF